MEPNPSPSLPEPTQRLRQWHRLFGLMVSDLFYGSAYEVEIEKDLSMRQQLLDVVVIERRHGGQLPDPLPDGLEQLNGHNLMSYKSHHESFNAWAVKELIGHYVNYRKQESSEAQLIPEEQINLYAITRRYPQGLQAYLTPCVKSGIYDLRWGSDTIRFIVLTQISAEPHNDLWRLFSARAESVREAWQRYRPHRGDISSVIRQLLEVYQLENPEMSYTLEQFNKEYVTSHIHLLSPEERLHGLAPDEVLHQYSPDIRLKDLSPKEIVNHLSPEALAELLRQLQNASTTQH